MNIDDIIHANPSNISSSISNYFFNLFNSNYVSHASSNFLPTDNSILTFLRSELMAPISLEEVKDVIFSTTKYALLSLNGYTFELFVHSWYSIGNFVFNAIQHFFFNRKLPIRAKLIIIFLIPRNSHALDIWNYKPICLCNAFYKFITNRIKLIFPLYY